MPDFADRLPIASLGHFYDNDELGRLAERAGFHDVSVSGQGGQLLTGAA